MLKLVKTIESCKDLLIAQISSQKDAKVAVFQARIAAVGTMEPHIMRAKHGGAQISEISDVLSFLRAQPAAVDFVQRIMGKAQRMPTALGVAAKEAGLKCDPLAAMRDALRDLLQLPPPANGGGGTGGGNPLGVGVGVGAGGGGGVTNRGMRRSWSNSRPARPLSASSTSSAASNSTHVAMSAAPGRTQPPPRLHAVTSSSSPHHAHGGRHANGQSRIHIPSNQQQHNAHHGGDMHADHAYQADEEGLPMAPIWQVVIYIRCIQCARFPHLTDLLHGVV